jgi:hypothetical protein
VGSIASLKVALIATFRGAPVAPLTGELDRTVGTLGLLPPQPLRIDINNRAPLAFGSKHLEIVMKER